MNTHQLRARDLAIGRRTWAGPPDVEYFDLIRRLGGIKSQGRLKQRTIEEYWGEYAREQAAYFGARKA